MGGGRLRLKTMYGEAMAPNLPLIRPPRWGATGGERLRLKTMYGEAMAFLIIYYF